MNTAVLTLEGHGCQQTPLTHFCPGSPLGKPRVRQAKLPLSSFWAQLGQVPLVPLGILGLAQVDFQKQRMSPSLRSWKCLGSFLEPPRPHHGLRPSGGENVTVGTGLEEGRLNEAQSATGFPQL